MNRRYVLYTLVVVLTLTIASTPACIEGFSASLGDARLVTSKNQNESSIRFPPGSGSGDVTSHGNFDQPDMFTGTASYRYELQLPPGTNGMTPKLALVYRSNGDNGWFGMGWEMEGLGYIEYSNKFGVPKYDGTDKEFVLNMGGSTYELIPDDSNDNPEANTGYYHTRCETWMKIYFDGSFWTVTDRNGVEWRFGYNADARVPLAGNPKIRLWALDRKLDKHGNFITYSYILDSPNGEYYPNTITYTQNVNTTLTKIKTVTFVREPRTDNIRPYARWMAHRINEILVSIDGTPAERYVLSYRYSNCSFRSLLASVSRFGNGMTPETIFMSYAADNGSLTWDDFGSQYPTNARNSERFQDFNGDGLMDNQIVSGQLFSIYDSNGRYISAHGTISDNIRAIDINCDGKCDLVGIYSCSINEVYINNYPNGWIRNLAWIPPSSQSGDYNNDAIPDCLTGTRTYFSSTDYDGWQRDDSHLTIGSSLSPSDYLHFDINGDYWSDIYLTESRLIKVNSTTGAWMDNSTWMLPVSGSSAGFCDVNGDGLADYRCLSNLYLNNGHGWLLSNWTNPIEYVAPSEIWLPIIYPSIDVNNDGLLDFVNAPSKPVTIRRPDGTTESRNKASTNATPSHLNDDPFLDFQYIWVNGDITYCTKYLSNAQPDLLTSVKLPTGGTVSWEYKRTPVVSYMSKDENGNLLPMPIRRGGVWRQYVVSKIATTDGTGRPDATYTSSFDYLDYGRYDRSDKTFLGFRRVKKTMPNGEYTITYFNQDLECSGRIERVETYTSSGQLLQEQINIWEAKEVTGSRGYAVILTAEETKNHGAHPSHGRTEYSYDACGNVTTEMRLGEVDGEGADLSPDDNLKIERSYINDTTNRLIGLPSRETAKNSVEAILADKLFWYDNLPHGQAVKGLLTEEKTWLDRFNAAPTCDDATFLAANSGRPNPDPLDPHPLITYTYDAFGNRTSTTKHNVLPDGTYQDQTETTVYDDQAHCFPVTMTNAAGHVTLATWDYGLGKPLTVTDPNGGVTRYTYDSLGRVTEEYGPRDGTNPRVKYDYTYALTGNPANQYIKVERQTNVGSATYLWTKNYLDGFGRVWKEEKQAPEGKVSIKEQQYEWHGHLGKEWLPYFSGSTRPEPPKISVYDALDRPVSVTTPDGKSTTFTYDSLVTSITDANGHVTRQIKDVYDRLVQVEQVNDDGTYVTKYEYDALGRQTCIKDAKYNAGQSTVKTDMTYDSMGRLLTRIDPYAGSTTYEYDLVGNLIAKTDAKGNRLLYEYDELNRLWTKSVLEPGQTTPLVLAVYNYDETTSTNGKGQLTSTYLGSSVNDAKYNYDLDGNLTETVKYISGTVYTTKVETDPLGRLRRLIYPDNTVLDYGYDAGSLKTVGSYATYSNWNAAGLPQDVTYGNSTKTTYAYDPKTLRLTSLVTKDPALNIIQSFTYGFDDVGNVTSITDSAPITAIHALCTSQTFTYDFINRLKSSNVFGSYAYDRVGNIIAKEGVTFTFDDPAHPYCPTEGSDGYRAAYDQNGNLAEKWDAQGNYWRYEYDCENMLSKVYKGPNKGTEVLLEEYSYGADGLRTKKTTYADGVSITTYYIYFGNNVIYAAESGGTVKKLVWDNARLVAEVEGGGITYNHPDHLGSTSLRTGASGQVLSFVGTKPYGAFYNQSTNTVRDDEFTDTSKVDGTHTTATVETSTGKVVSGYTNQACNEILYSNTTTVGLPVLTGDDYVEIKNWSFTINENDYRRELKIEADIEGFVFLYTKFTGYLRAELVKPDGSRDLIFSGSKLGEGMQLFSGTKSLDSLAPGNYRIVILIKGGVIPYGSARNRIFRVTLTAKRIYQTITGYTTKPCNEIVHAVNSESSTTNASDYIQVKSYSFTLATNDERDALFIEADVGGFLFGFGYLQVVLVKPDGTIEPIFSGMGTTTMQMYSGVMSLEGLPPGTYRIAVMLKTGISGYPAYNKIFRVTLTATRVYRTSSELRTTALTSNFDILSVKLNGNTTESADTSVSWSFSTDGGSTWIPIIINASLPTELTQPTREVILRAILNGTITETPAINSYKLTVYGAWTMGPGVDPDLRFTGKELDISTGLEYFGARYYDPEVGRFTTVDPVRDGLNWYGYCNNNPLKYIDPAGTNPTLSISGPDQSFTLPFYVVFSDGRTMGVLVEEGSPGVIVPAWQSGITVYVMGEISGMVYGDQLYLSVDAGASAYSKSSNIFGLSATVGLQIDISDDNGRGSPLFGEPFGTNTVSKKDIIMGTTELREGGYVFGHSFQLQTDPSSIIPITLPTESIIDLKPDTLTLSLTVYVSIGGDAYPIYGEYHAGEVDFDEPGGGI